MSGLHITKQYTLIKWLSRLIEQGYSLRESVYRLSLIEKKAMKQLFVQIEQGLPLNEAIRTLRFKPYAYEFITIGLKSNRLDRSLQLLVKRYEFDLTVYKLWLQLLFYPTVLFLLALVGFEYLRIQLYPPLLRMMETETVSIPPVLIFLAFHLLKLILVGVIVLYVVFRRFPRLFNVIPLIKEFRTLTFCHQYHLFLQSGYSLDEALEQLVGTMDHQDINDIRRIILDPTVERHPLSRFTESFIQVLFIGLSTNQLSEQLSDYMSLSFEIFQSKIKRLIQRVQYGLFLIIALNILMVYYVMMMPIIHITDWL